MANSVSISTIEDAIYDWAHLVLPTTPIIWYHENAPRPTTPYVAFHLTSITSVGVDHVSGDGQMTGNRDCVLLCQAFGKSSADLLEELRSSIERPEIYFYLQKKGVVFVERMAISDSAIAVDNRYEERNIMDLKFRYAQQSVDGSGIISFVNAEGVYTVPIFQQ